MLYEKYLELEKQQILKNNSLLLYNHYIDNVLKHNH